MKILSSTIPGPNLLPEHAVILDIASHGRYWRSSPLVSVSVISQEAGEPRETTWLSEKEPDEYDILEALGKYLPGHDTVITFNGQSYDIPFLKKKFSAYGLSDPLAGIRQRDLFREYRPLKAVLGLPSGKLVDYDEYIRMHTEPGAGSSTENERLPDISSGKDLSTADAVRTLLILGFDAVLELLHGSFDSVQAEALEDLVMFRIRTLRIMPCRISFHDGPFHLTASGRTAALSSRIEDGRIRFYHSDIKNYIYLPHEGYAVYRTMAEFVDKSHRKKATRETCYTYAVPGSAFLENPEQVSTYVKASLIYLGGRQ
ncbi:MAG: ribonuclease H-like domain-containing protein [Chordicoccus sp.]